MESEEIPFSGVDCRENYCEAYWLVTQKDKTTTISVKIKIDDIAKTIGKRNVRDIENFLVDLLKDSEAKVD